jgi:alpha-tubulin suppressor-like RCC1 family protein
MNLHPQAHLRGQRPREQGFRAFLGAILAALASVSAMAQPGRNDIVGWGVLEYDTRNTATYRTSVDSEVFQVSCGGGHTLALRLDPSILTVAPCTPLAAVCQNQEGVVMAWGFNDFGQCSIGLETDPVTGIVLPWKGIQVAAGYAHSMLLRADGSVRCWGDNTFGQCSVPTEAADPVRDTLGNAINPVVQIAAGNDFSLALLQDGRLLAWGANDWEQLKIPTWGKWVGEDALGYDPDHPGSATDTSFDGEQVRFFSISAGGHHVVALMANDQRNGDFGENRTLSRRVMAWGRNNEGQCRIGVNPGASAQSSQMFRKLPSDQWPVPLSSVDQKFESMPMLAQQVAAGQFHSLALTGRMPAVRYYKSKQPRAGNTDSPYEEIASSDTLVFGSGADVFGQATMPIQRATTDPLYRNWTLSAPIKWASIAAGGYHSMAVSDTGFVYSWGQGAKGFGFFGDYGQVHDDPEKEFAKQRVDFYQPQPGVLCDVAGQYANSRLISAGLYHSATVSLQWDLRPSVVVIAEPVNVAVTWGRNFEAQCGVPYETNYSLMRNIATKAPTMSRTEHAAIVKKTSVPSQPRSRYTSDIRAVWAGGFMPNREYGFFSDYMIGLNRLGLPVGLGDDTNLQRSFFLDGSPIISSPSLKYQAVAPGGMFSWLLSTDGRVFFFGDPFPLYSGESDIPNISAITDVSAGAFHTLFRQASGQVFTTGGRASTYYDDKVYEEVQINWAQGAWGSDGSFLGGDLASGTRQVGLLATKISAGWFHSAAVTDSGSIACWGAGTGATNTPIQVHHGQSQVPASLTGCTDVAAGGYHTVALTNVNPGTGVGTVRAWGSERNGQSSIDGLVSAVTCPNAVVVRRARGEIVAWGNPVPEADDIAVGAPDTYAIFAGYGTTGFIDRAGVLQMFGDLASATDPATIPLDPATGAAIRLRSVAFGEDHAVGLRPDGTVVCWGNSQGNEFLQTWLIDNDPWNAVSQEVTFNARDQLDTLFVPLTTYSSGDTSCVRLPYEFLVRRSNMGPGALYSVCNGVGNETLAACATLDPVGIVRKQDSNALASCTLPRESCGGCDLGPSNVPLLAIQVAAGRHHSVAVRADGVLQAWGATSRDPASTEFVLATQDVVKSTPGAAGPFGFAFTKVAAATNHNIALRIDGSAAVWGNIMAPEQEYGVLKPSLGFDLSLLGYGNADVACGERHAVLLRSNGEVIAWGDEVVQQDGSVTRPPDSPAAVPSGQRGLAIAAGGDNTVVLEDAFTPLVFGGLTDIVKPTLTDVTLNAVAVRAGGFHSLALQADGTVVGWGAGLDRDGGTSPYVDQDSLNFPQYGQADVPSQRPNYLAPLQARLPISATNPSPFAAGPLTSVVVLDPPLALTLGTGGARSTNPASDLPDLDGDGCVTTNDLSVLLLEVGNAAWPGADLDGSGEIDMGDIALLQLQLGECEGSAPQPVAVE